MRPTCKAADLSVDGCMMHRIALPRPGFCLRTTTVREGDLGAESQWGRLDSATGTCGSAPGNRNARLPHS